MSGAEHSNVEGRSVFVCPETGTVPVFSCYCEEGCDVMTVIDNYDSFTYNLVQYLRELGQEVRVVRNDAVTVEEIARWHPTHLLISPGPCTPNEAGISVEAVRYFKGKIPILGVCLGHQAIGQAFGARIVKAPRLMHGKVSTIEHHGASIFKGVPNPFTATRYHSLIIEKESLPSCLEVIATATTGEIMGVKHVEYNIIGLQFHPESILTEGGMTMLRNFVHSTEREALPA
jgi:para-aminobenzoate synthetase component 2